jgi:thiol-disulfide isomerase/thioredoxin
MRPAFFLAFGLVVIGAGAVGFYGYRGWQGDQASTPPGAIAAVAAAAVPSGTDAQASAPEEPARSPVPETVPALSLPDLGGQLKSLHDYLGHPLIINFWATWCGPCRREIPLLQQLRKTYKAQKLEVVGIAVDFRSAVSEYVAKVPIAYPLLIGDDQGLAAAEKFGMEPVLPFSVFADAKGQIIAVKIGELHKDEADFILATMTYVSAGKMSPLQARAAISEKLRVLAIQRAKTGNNNS